MIKFDKENLNDCPSMEEMFKRADKMKQKIRYTTEEIVKLIKEHRNEEMHLVKGAQ